jgi:hypothetical protein
MLPEGLGCALHDKETAVLELDRDRRAVTFAFVAKGKFPLGAKAERANRGIFPERLFVVAVPPMPSFPSWYRLQRHELNKHPTFSSTRLLRARNSLVQGSAILVVPE